MKYIRYFPSLIVFLLYFLLSVNTIQAKSGQTFEVNVDQLNIRAAPSSNAEVVGTLQNGNRVTIFQEDNGWFQTYFQGEKVWVASKHLRPIQEKDVRFVEDLLSGYTIIIDPGHGGKDPGAIGQNGIMEKDLILETSLKIANQLMNVGANVILTRKDDSFVSLKDRVLISNLEDADAFISIHFNSYPEDYVGGINTYYHQSGQVLANKIQHALAEEVSLRNRGVIQSNYRVLRENKHPAILVELGFITNTTELETIQSESYQDKVAWAITQGLVEYFFE